jgi:hypothetical protein
MKKPDYYWIGGVTRKKPPNQLKREKRWHQTKNRSTPKTKRCIKP